PRRFVLGGRDHAATTDRPTQEEGPPHEEAPRVAREAAGRRRAAAEAGKARQGLTPPLSSRLSAPLPTQARDARARPAGDVRARSVRAPGAALRFWSPPQADAQGDHFRASRRGRRRG